jgi:hypothetical protein
MAFSFRHSTHQETSVLIPQIDLSLCVCVPDREALNAFGAWCT